MHAKDAIKQAYELSQMVVNAYVGDLSDEELLQRPGEGCNHLAWQLGHLISSECNLLEMAVPGAAAELPDGFADRHGKENANSDNASEFHTKAEYQELMSTVKAATFAAIDGLGEGDLDKPGPENMRDFCPTVGSLFMLIGTHYMMHAGQAVPIRRRLDKPVVM